jgi:hypothetical protein
MPLIPQVKIKLGGNRGAGQSYIKFATAQLAILERQMSFQKLNEGSRVVSPIEGVTVWCWSKFGKKEVHIQVDPPSVLHPEITRGRMPYVAKPIPELLPFDAIPLFALGEFESFAGGVLKGKKRLLINNDTVGTSEPFVASTPVSDHYPLEGLSNLQVKYLEEECVFDVEGEEVILKNLSFSISIVKRDTDSTSVIVTVSQPSAVSLGSLDSTDGEDIVNESLKYQATEELAVHKFDLLLEGTASTANTTANFNTDKTVLYVYKWNKNSDKTSLKTSIFVPVYPIEQTPSSTGQLFIYDRKLVDNVITWELRVSRVLTIDAYMAGCFIDNNGLLHGFHKTIEEDFGGFTEVGTTECYSYASLIPGALERMSSTDHEAGLLTYNTFHTVDLNVSSPVLSASNNHTACVGTVIDGEDLAGLYSLQTIEASWEAWGTYRTWAAWGWVWHDDGTGYQLESDPECVGTTWHLPYSTMQSGIDRQEDPWFCMRAFAPTTTLFAYESDEEITRDVSSIVAYTMADPSSVEEDEMLVAHNGELFGEGYSNGGIYKTREVLTGYQDTENTGLLAGYGDGEKSFGGDVINTNTGIPVSRSYTGTHIYRADYPGSTDSDVYAPSNFVETGQASSETLYPLEIPLSTPLKAFMLYDQTTTPARDFRGVYYTKMDATTGDPIVGSESWKVTLNGIDVTANLLSVLGCNDKNLNNLGLLW